MNYYGMPESVPGVNKVASIHKIASGWLVSYRPKQEIPSFTSPDPEKLREQRKAALKEEIEKQALIYKAAAKAIHGEDEEWKDDGNLDDAVSAIVPHDAPAFGGLGNYVMAVQDEARAFATLAEALDFLKTVLE